MFKTQLACLLAAVIFATDDSAQLLAAENSDAPSCEVVREWCKLMTEYERKWEGYTVTTDDQWELTLFRILPGTNAQVYQSRRDVLFLHSFMHDATSWLMGTNLNVDQEKEAEIV